MKHRKEKNQSLIDILNWRATIHPEKIAYTFLIDGENEEEKITYLALDQNAKSVAAYLQSLNLEGERALLLFPSGIDYITAFFGCLYAGVIAVPAYPPRKNRLGERIDAIISDSGAKAALTTSKIFSDLNRKFEDEQYLKDLTWIETNKISGNNNIWVKPNLNPDTLAFLQYTSGSTGTPKGVMISHGNILANSEYIKQSYLLNEESVSVFWVPIFHDLGLMDGIIQPLYSGYHGVVMAPVSFLEKPIRWLNAITKYRATHTGGPNFAYDLCISKVTNDQIKLLDLSCWETALTGAEHVRYNTWKRFSEKFESCGFRSNFYYPAYGLAESTLLVTGSDFKEEPSFCKVNANALKNNTFLEVSGDSEGTMLMSSGKTILDTKVVIADPDTLELCKPERIGEVWVSSPSVAKGYWKRAQDTQETFGARLKGSDDGPFLRTGDLGFLKDDKLYITGRLKDIIIIRGQNYYPQDIEFTVEHADQALKASGGAAFSVEVNGEERLVVIQEVERIALRGLKVEEVCDNISEAISQNHELKVYAIVLIQTGSLPKTSSGKIQRKGCKKAFLDGVLKVVGERHERESLEKLTDVDDLKFESFARSSELSIQKWLVLKVAEYFKVNIDSISLHDTFDKLGLDSMIAIQLSADLGKWLNKEISQTVVYNYPTIKSLASYLFNEVSKQNSINSSVEDRPSIEEHIAIVGMGCRFPGASNPEEYLRLLEAGESSISEVPQERWNFDQLSNLTSEDIEAIKWGGVIKNIDQFDPQFFGISPKEAVNIDPQQRLLLEVSWEALEDAGIPPSTIAGQNIGVFIGVSTNDYGNLYSNDISKLNAYSGTGSAFSIVANRLSYVLDLRGPSISIDTACSSSLVAVHQACQSLRGGESNVAIAGGVNLLLTPKWSIVFSRAQMLAKDGKCKTFDAGADGYVRGEGCGVVILKTLSEAIKNGDTIHAVIRGSAINQDGRSNGLTAPNGPSQEMVIQKALHAAKVASSEIGYVETHGSGTPLGDPIEINALKKILMQQRNSDASCYIGSVKTNIGHLEAAAGIAGLIKVVLSLKHKKIFPHLNFNLLNQQIRIEDTPIKIPTTVLTWQSDKRFAGVSSFGFGGTNAHVVLEEPPVIHYQPTFDRPVQVFTLSAKTEKGLDDLCDRYILFLNADHNFDLKDICYSANTGRNHFSNRLAIITNSIQDLKVKLDAYKLKKETPNLFYNQVRPQIHKQIAFLFTGQGSQYKGMAKELYETEPVFKKYFEKCDSILKGHLNLSLAEALYFSENSKSDFNVNNTLYTQPLLFAIEYSLAMLWKTWGVEPSVVMGHSVGEYVAACIAQVFSLEDGLKLISERARLMQNLPASEGEMIAVSATEVAVMRIIHPHRALISIAAVNGPDQIVVSGDKEAMKEIINQLESLNIKWMRLHVSHAFHSPLMKPILHSFEKIARSIKYTSPAVNLISNVTGNFINEEICTAEYWVNHITSPVLFFKGVSTLHKNKYSIFIEIGPKSTLLSMIKSYLKEVDVLMLSTINVHESNWQTLLRSLALLYMQNIDIDWNNVYRNYGSKISLPLYPFQRSRYWITDGVEKTVNSQGNKNEKRISKSHPILGFLMQEDFVSNNFSWERKIDSSFLSNLNNEQYEDKIFIPFTTYLEIATSAVKETFGDRNIQLKDVKIHHPFLNSIKENTYLRTKLYKSESGQLSFQISTLINKNSINQNEILFASAKIDLLVFPNYSQRLN